jgi:hypothetical protein
VLRRAESYSALDPHARLLTEAEGPGQLAPRFMHSYQRGLLVLVKVRTGNRQTVTVIHQHVTVAGGQVAVSRRGSRAWRDGAVTR